MGEEPKTEGGHETAAARIKSVREFEKWLRLHGWPHKAAKTIASHGFATLIGEETEEMQLLKSVHSMLANGIKLR